jgi:hypothetical protein
MVRVRAIATPYLEGLYLACAAILSGVRERRGLMAACDSAGYTGFPIACAGLASSRTLDVSPSKAGLRKV